MTIPKYQEGRREGQAEWINKSQIYSARGENMKLGHKTNTMYFTR